MDQGTGEYGITEFATMTVDEFTRHQTGLKMKPRRRNFGNKSNDSKLRFKKELPESWDWTEHGVVTEVKNQGMCGSCWAFSTTGNIEGVWAKQTGELVELSEQELVDCDQVDQGCNGGLMDDAFAEIVRLGGLETEGDYGYDGRREECHFEPDKARVFINGSLDISEDEQEIAEALVEHGPLSIALNAAWMQFYHGGVSHPISQLCNPDGLDHGVLLVGYGVEEHTNWRHWHPRPYWKIKNSWGPHWGEGEIWHILTSLFLSFLKTDTTASIAVRACVASTSTSPPVSLNRHRPPPRLQRPQAQRQQRPPQRPLQRTLQQPLQRPLQHQLQRPLQRLKRPLPPANLLMKTILFN